MAWGKKVTVTVGYASDEDGTNQGIDVSSLDLSFKIYRSNKFSDQKAEITIYNISLSTEEQFIKADLSDLNVWLGYQDEKDVLVFVGHVVDVHGEWTGADRKLTILAKTIRATGLSEKELKAVSGVSVLTGYKTVKKKDKLTGKPYEERVPIYKTKELPTGVQMENALNAETSRIYSNTYMQLTLAPGSKIQDLLNAIATATGFPLTIVSPTGSLFWELPNGYVNSASLKTILREVSALLWAYNYTMYFNLAEWIVYNPYDTVGTISCAVLNQKSGLLGVEHSKIYEYDPKHTEVLPPTKTWQVRSIINPSLAPNALVDIDTTGLSCVDLSGTFLIESVEFTGDNMDGDYTATTMVSTNPQKVTSGGGGAPAVTRRTQ